MPSVLIVDDLISIHEMLEAVIQPTGFSTAFATDGEKALARYKGERFDMVLADIDMKPMDGITLLKQLKLYDPNSVTIIMTAYASTDSAVQALKYGAFDYLQKPFRVDELIGTLRRGLEFREIQAQRALISTGVGLRPDDIEGRLVGKSQQIKKLIQKVKKLAAVRTPVLLVGENGTGKTSVAEILHGVTGASQAQFVRIDCSLSSEQNFREGLLGANGEGGPWIRDAKGGTLFLQHLQCLALPVQKELVSVLRNTAHGFRLLCTTTEDLEKMVDEGRFNEELFYRVASLPLHMPPLRDRKEDIPILVKHIAVRATNPLVDPNLIEFTGDAMAVFSGYHWPGNLAELSQLVLKLASTTETRVITSQQLPLRLRDLKHWPKLADYIEGQQKQYLDRVLHACRGDKAAAAEVLGIDVAELG
ncbi:MAG TPA: response regulator [Opitutaceae bacterium]|nr:response regulator [Opitutaceae bacterium]